MIYAVVDTNVIVSSFITKNPASPTIQVAQMILDGRFVFSNRKFKTLPAPTLCGYPCRIFRNDKDFARKRR